MDPKPTETQRLEMVLFYEPCERQQMCAAFVDVHQAEHQFLAHTSQNVFKMSLAGTSNEIVSELRWPFIATWFNRNKFRNNYVSCNFQRFVPILRHIFHIFSHLRFQKERAGRWNAQVTCPTSAPKRPPRRCPKRRPTSWPHWRIWQRCQQRLNHGKTWEQHVLWLLMVKIEVKISWT